VVLSLLLLMAAGAIKQSNQDPAAEAQERSAHERCAGKLDTGLAAGVGRPGALLALDVLINLTLNATVTRIPIKTTSVKMQCTIRSWNVIAP
jgi:hypothetical protein